MEEFANALLDKREVQTQTMIINGIPQSSGSVTQYFIKCSKCRQILGTFNPGDPLRAVIEACKQDASKRYTYCIKCGRKLNFTMDIIDVIPVEVKPAEEASK